MKSIICLLIILLSSDLSLGKVFSKCGFAIELFNHGMNPKEIANWVCIAEFGSQFNTSARRGPDADQSMYHGPFLISDRWWCANGSKKSENYCQVKCSDLRKRRITPSVNCARKIYQQHGYEAWTDTWPNHCKDKLPNINNCLSTDGRYGG